VAKNPELKNNPSLELLRKSLLKEPLAFYSALRDRLQSSPSTRPEALAKLSRAQNELAFTHREVGQITDAINAMNESIQIWEQLVQFKPDVVDYKAQFAAELHDLGNFLDIAGQFDKAQAAFQRAYSTQESLLNADPSNFKLRADLGDSLDSIAGLYRARGDLKQALDFYERALKSRTEVADALPQKSEAQRDLASSLNNIAILHGQLGRNAEAIKEQEAALE
jgi:tetratricopeptide (TPR) repeat protein